MNEWKLYHVSKYLALQLMGLEVFLSLKLSIKPITYTITFFSWITKYLSPSLLQSVSHIEQFRI